MDLFHYRLKAILTMNTKPRNLKIKRFVQQLIYLAYTVLVFTAVSYLGLLKIQSSQDAIKPLVFEVSKLTAFWF